MIREAQLLLYKGRPALVKKTHSDDRLEIETMAGEFKKVRPKDVVTLHPGPVANLRDLERPIDAEELKTAWELLQGEADTDLRALTQLLFAADTPATAWSTWKLVADGLYFSGTPNSIRPQSPQAVDDERRHRETRQRQKQHREAFLQRMRSAQWAPEDEPFLADIENRAMGGSSRASDPILRDLGRAESAEGAHALLLEVGRWSPARVPYPQRFGINLTPPVDQVDTTVTGPGVLRGQDDRRLDLTHLDAFAIDDEGNSDPDDAVGIDGTRVWVHVADVSACVEIDSLLDQEARNRASTMYLPERTVPMLPASITQQVGMGLGEVSPALSFGIEVDDEGCIAHFEIVPTLVRVKRLTYPQADKLLDSEPLHSLQMITDRSRRRRQLAGAAFIEMPETKITVGDTDGTMAIEFESLPPLAVRELVAEAMILAGEAAALYASRESLPCPFSGQPPPTEDGENDPDGLAGMFALRRRQPRSRITTSMDRHSGLGLTAYARVTSPLRRYLDLVAHQQLKGHLSGRTTLDEAQLLHRVGPAQELAADIRRVERLSIRHWTCVYLMQSPGWTGNGILVDRRGPSGTMLIADLGLQTQLHLPFDFSLNSQLRLQLKGVDLPRLDPHFAVESF